jgi:hypothetical protein
MKLDLPIECSVCGNEMVIETVYDKRVKWLQFIGKETLLEVDQCGDRLCVSPCSTCELDEFSNGQDEGYEAGFKDGRDFAIEEV